mgnify:CR=1 FL=1|jgi:hypothetical protein
MKKDYTAEIFNEVLEIVLFDKECGKDRSFRTNIYAIIAFNRKWKNIGVQITRQLIEDVATAVGGQYIKQNGSSHIKF